MQDALREESAQSTVEYAIVTVALLSIVLAIAASYILKHTRVGLHLRAVGESPNTADAAALIGEYGIVDAAVAEKALPYCNIVCLTGADLLEALPGYLEVLYNADPAAVGGEMPDNSFYFA